MERSRDVAPTDLDSRPVTLSDIASPRLRAIARDNSALAPHARASRNCLDHGFGRATRRVCAERKIEFEVIGVGQSALQMRREAVARCNVEANSGEEHYASRLGFGVPRGESLKDVNFPGDVEVVNTITETAIPHWPRRRGERTCGAEHDCDVLDRRIDTRGVAKIKRSCAQTKRLGDPFDFIKISSGQDWARSPIAG